MMLHHAQFCRTCLSLGSSVLSCEDIRFCIFGYVLTLSDQVSLPGTDLDFFHMVLILITCLRECLTGFYSKITVSFVINKYSVGSYFGTM